MIDLTPLEVRQKKNDLPRGLRGYDPGHVDDFLDLVADRLEALVKENRRLAEELETLRASAGEYRDREKALTEALVSAQQMRESVREQSTREAELMRREAEHEAQRVRDDALRAIGHEEETLRRLRARQRQLVEGYRGMLERELRELAVVADSLEAGEPVSVPAVAPAAAAAVAPVEAEKVGGGEGREPDGRAAATGADSAATRADSAATRSMAAATGSTVATGATAEESRSERERVSPPSVGSAGQARPPEAGGRGAGEGDATPAAGDAPAVGDAPRAAGDGSPAEDAGEEAAERRAPWTVPPPASPRPAGDRRGHGRDRYAPPAAALGRTDPRPGRPDEAAGGEAAKPGRSGDDEPDWLAAILKED